MGRIFALILAASLQITGCSTQSPASLPDDVALVVFGDVDIDVLTSAERSLRDNYKLVIDVRYAELPEEAYYEERGRYRAELLLDFLEEKYSRYDRIVALTSEDISTTKDDHDDWGIFGLGKKPGKSCVVSSYRLDGEEISEEKFKERVYKVVLHEYGHTTGLPHCEESDVCPMQDAQGKVSTVDGSQSVLCTNCQDQAKEFVREVRL